MTAFQDSTIPLPIAERPVTIGEMVVADYRKAEVFRKYGIDYCCGGKKPLEEACRKKGLDPNLVQQELDAVEKRPAAAHQDFNTWELDALADHIVEKHHRYVAASLPILYELTAKVARVHGERHPELVEIARLFNAVAQELQMHMHKEEHVLFPYIAKMAAAQRIGAPLMPPFFGSVENPIRMMMDEHESAGEDMEDIRRLSDDYTPPMDACTSYRVLFAKLHEFEQDLHQHVHLENNILFPKSIAMEKEAVAA
ncbi:MAG: iron-sulfur cluster repair di-iron protein [Saprospiraceae bacterium]|jgi:regulator of cell morphogenesis and NO signaling|nr:iron-sulfur cluster repair di-iron protein [Saprospiraceae bacterium]